MKRFVNIETLAKSDVIDVVNVWKDGESLVELAKLVFEKAKCEHATANNTEEFGKCATWKKMISNNGFHEIRKKKSFGHEIKRRRGTRLN